MTEKELRIVYASACSGKGFEPNDGQFKVWKQTLGWCDERDLAQALIWFYEEDTTFPMPAELKPLAERARRERAARSEVRRGLVMWKCPVCAWKMAGFLTLEDRALRFCRSSWGPSLPVDAPRVNGTRPERKQLGQGVTCGTQLDILHDER